MPAPQTTRRSMIALSNEEANITKAHGADPDTAGFLLGDNCQNYHKQNDLRVGRESVINVGMAGLYFEAADVDPAVFDLADKWKRIAQGLRKSVTVDNLLELIDSANSELVGSLMIVEALARLIPSLYSLRAEIHLRRGATATHVHPATQDVVHPLASNGKKEMIPVELKDGMLDFAGQIGQTSTQFLKRKLPVGGDGLTYAMLLQLQIYLQFHNDPFQSFEIFEPQLQVWHTKWTDIIRIFQTHWGRTSGRSTNPASLGYSAGKIGRAARSNMKKVEFYQGSQLLNTAKMLPDMETLLPMVRKLYRAYATARGRDHALYNVGETSEWANMVPAGSVWTPAEIEDSSIDKKPKKTKATEKQPKNPRKPKKKPPPKQYDGDFVLAQEIDFIRDTMNSRKLATAVAEGDIGRLYECIKYMLFTFGGSSHTNYLGYLLETVMNLEFESSPGLKWALLRGLVGI
ncbi:hypothetical protein B0H10DRAFT_1957326 [Mycena sp. CBHHK59/15]|nr:hypothetical protein B0H10DRAFT_1957326 [Mycena sp. CBHHK59/15]